MSIKNYFLSWIASLMLAIIAFFSICVCTAQSDPKSENSVARAVFDQEYAPLLLDLIHKSKVSIYASHFSFFTEDEFCVEILKELGKAKERDVSITIFLEGSKKGTGERNTKTLEKLRKMGIKAFLNTSARVAHAKIFVVDSKWVLAGSTNLSYSSMANNHESNILIKSKAIAQSLEKYIQELLLDSDREITIESKTDNQIMAITDGNFFSYALDLIQNAKEEICIATYMFDYPQHQSQSNVARLFYELIKAKKRGVQIRIFLEQSSFRFNAHIHQKNLESANFLWEKGIKNIRFDRQKQVTHSKIILCDRKKALVGSTNWYLHDIDYAHQVNFIVEEHGVVRQLIVYFEKLYGEGVTEPGSNQDK